MAFPVENWPYSDLHNLNLDWVLKTMKEAVEQVQNALDSVTPLKEAVAKNTADIAALGNTVEGQGEQIDKLLTCCAQVQAELGDIQSKLLQLSAAITTAENNANNYTDIQIAAVKTALDNGGLLYVMDPTSGNKVDIQTALDNLAGLAKDDAITAGEYDAKNITAGVYDALNLTAYEYDYHAKTFLQGVGS